MMDRCLINPFVISFISIYVYIYMNLHLHYILLLLCLIVLYCIVYIFNTGGCDNLIHAYALIAIRAHVHSKIQCTNRTVRHSCTPFGGGAIPLGDKVFFRRVGTRGEILREASAKTRWSRHRSYGTLTSLTPSTKRVPKCTPDGWLYQGCFVSGEQQATPAATGGETSSRKTVNGEMYARICLITLILSTTDQFLCCLQ